MKPEGLYGEFDHVSTGIYIPIDTLLLIFTFVIDIHYRFKKKILKRQNLTLCHNVLLYCDVAIGVYEVIHTHCSSQCYVGRNSCKCNVIPIATSQYSIEACGDIELNFNILSLFKHFFFSNREWLSITNVNISITSTYCNGDRYRCSPNTSPFSKWCNYSLSHR
jgi:hypothetical protein